MDHLTGLSRITYIKAQGADGCTLRPACPAAVLKKGKICAQQMTVDKTRKEGYICPSQNG